ncbi:hypothetical protein ACFYWX_25530 [Streptomyces sp. NPDC002888]|uniref:hypothetical protein n=1 Tax=Streptomyces sp. NPDC002888 TaxID=3364668 RepID=UPI0036A652CD
MTTVGRKSGEPRSTPGGWFPGADGSWLIVASAARGREEPGPLVRVIVVRPWIGVRR